MHYNYLTTGGAISFTPGGEGELVHFSGIFLYGDPGRTGPATIELTQACLACLSVPRLI